MMKTSVWAVAAACGLMTAGAAPGAVVSFQQGTTNPLTTGNYTGTQDTFLNEGAPEASYGALTVAIAGRDGATPTSRTALLRFNISALAGQYSAINSATVTVYQRETSAQFSNFDVSAYEVSAANGAWVQGTTDTAEPNTAGNADWNHMTHDTAAWAGSAGMSTAGTDYTATALSTVTWDSGTSSVTDKNNTAYTFTIPGSLIEQWAAGNNSGLMIQKVDLTVAGLAQFASAEWNTDPDGTGPLTAAMIRPKLTVDYTPVPEPTGVGAVAMGVLAVVARRRRG